MKMNKLFNCIMILILPANIDNINDNKKCNIFNSSIIRSRRLYYI